MAKRNEIIELIKNNQPIPDRLRPAGFFDKDKVTDVSSGTDPRGGMVSANVLIISVIPKNSRVTQDAWEEYVDRCEPKHPDDQVERSKGPEQVPAIATGSNKRARVELGRSWTRMST